MAARGVRLKGKRLKPGHNKGGYAYVGLYRDGVRYARRIHRLVLETFIGPCPEGMEACHNNGIRTDNRVNNLRWDTSSANHLDAVRHGTHPGFQHRGEANRSAKLTDQQVRQIIYTYRTGLFTQRKIAKQFETGNATINRIVNRKSWRHLWTISCAEEALV